MTAFIDTNIIVRHLTADPPAMAKHATTFLASQTELYLADLIVAETVYVLESFYKSTGVGAIASFDTALDRVSTVTRLEP